MAEPSKSRQEGGLPESLRTAIERTFAATADSAAETRERAGELLDEVARRGQEARDVVSRGRHEAGEASASAASRVIDAIERMRVATRDDLHQVEKEVKAL